MIEIVPYQTHHKDQLNALAVEAFLQFKDEYSDWDFIKSAIEKMSELQNSAELFVAKQDEGIVGAIALVKPGVENKHGKNPNWASIRMLVVSPQYRGQGIGKKLALKCLEQAKMNSYQTISLYTSPIMQVALQMYLRMGFEKVQDIEPISGVQYALYKLEL